MNGVAQLNKPPIDPIYSQDEPGQRIDLGLVAVEFEHKGKAYRDTARVAMKFMPNDRLEFICPCERESEFSAIELLVNAGDYQKLTLTSRGITLDVFCAAVGTKAGGIVFVPKQSGFLVTPRSSDISTVTFHLFNFPDLRGPDSYILLSGEPPLQGGKACGRVLLSAGGWTITVAATDRTDELTKALETKGGYVLTHVGRVVRDDGSTFSSDELEDLLTVLHYFFSFALGRWAGTALPVGFDAGGIKVFERWGMGMTADGPWTGMSWFDLHHGELLSQVFPGFFALFSNPVWRQPLTHALYWYLGASDRRVGIGVDTGLILAQAALEVLAWTYCVLDRKLLSPAAFGRRGLSAADKFRLLGTTLDVPQDIPVSLAALHARPGTKWKDSMDAITSIRNSLVHPDVKSEPPRGSYVDAWKLSLWYIDLVLLHLCGHNGKFANRLTERWVGQIEPVPWA